MLRINVWLKRCKETIKPWSEFMNMDKFKQPIDKNQCLARVRRNLDHFRSNYLILFVFLALYCMLVSSNCVCFFIFKPCKFELNHFQFHLQINITFDIGLVDFGFDRLLFYSYQTKRRNMQNYG